MSIRTIGGVLAPSTAPPPSEVATELSENFQVDFGQLVTPGTDDPRLAWTRIAGPTPTSSTGPSGGANPLTRAVEESNAYAYTEASDGAIPSNADTYSMESPDFDATTELFGLTFDVHMRFGGAGLQLDGTLEIQGWNGSAWSTIGTVITGSQQTSATAAYLPSSDFDTYDSTGFSNADFKFRFLFTEGTTLFGGGTFNYDCAVDNIEIDSVTPATSEVFTENFGTNFGLWNTPGVEDQEDAWTRTNGQTPSADTGPNGGAGTADLPDAGLSYVFTESSTGANSPWSLESPTIDASAGTTTLAFKLFMKFGVAGVLADGVLTVQGWNGSAWSTISNTVTGSQQTAIGDAWINSSVEGTYTSATFSNVDFKFRFLFARGAGDSFNYDCCIDTVVITAPIGAVTQTQTVTRVGIFSTVTGDDGVDNFPHTLNFPEPEQAHNRADVGSPLFPGGASQAISIEIRSGDPQWSVDAATGSPKRRAEYEWQAVRYANGQDGWFGFAFFLPSDPMANIRGCAFCQLHWFPDPSQMLVVSLFAGDIQFENPSRPGGPLRLADVNVTPFLDKWSTMICNFRPSRGGDGFIRIWLDDVVVVNNFGANKSSGNRGPYFKNGNYFWGYEVFDFTRRSRAFFDQLRLGDQTSNFESVDPSNTVIIAPPPPPPPVEGAPTPGTVTTFTNSDNPGSSPHLFNHNHTAGDLILLVCTKGNSDDTLTMTATYDSASMTEIGSSGANTSDISPTLRIFRLTGASTGTNQVSLAFTTASSLQSIGIVAVDVTNVVGVGNTASNQNGGDIISDSINITVAADSLVIGMASVQGADSDPFAPGAGYTEIVDQDTGGGSAFTDLGFQVQHQVFATSGVKAFNSEWSVEDGRALLAVELTGA